MIKVRRLYSHAVLPTKAHPSDAGWDLYYAPETDDPYLAEHASVRIRGLHRVVVPTGIAIEMPPDYVGLIWPRSGLAVKSGIHVMAGVIDSSYRGQIKVCLYNTHYAHEDGAVLLSPGDRIAQIIFHQLPQTELMEVAELDDTQRGEGGFGSSGR